MKDARTTAFGTDEIASSLATAGQPEATTCETRVSRLDPLRTIPVGSNRGDLAPLIVLVLVPSHRRRGSRPSPRSLSSEERDALFLIQIENINDVSGHVCALRAASNTAL